jgi:hypothetical protein
MSSERPSWKEIDKMRDGSGGRRQKKKAKEEVKEHSTRYDKYKADLHRLFDQGMAGELLKKVAKERHKPKTAEEPEASEADAQAADSGQEGQAEKGAKGVLRRKNPSGRIPADTSRSSSRFKLLRAIQDATERAALIAALDALVAAFGLPDDFEVLVRAVEHPDEKLVKQAIERMSARLESVAKVPRRASLKERLRTISQTAADPELRKAAQELETRL